MQLSKSNTGGRTGVTFSNSVSAPVPKFLNPVPGVKRNFWPVVVIQLFCLSEYRNKVLHLLFWCMLCQLEKFG